MDGNKVDETKEEKPKDSAVSKWLIFCSRNSNNFSIQFFQDDDPGAWEENFKSHHDSKPNGPEAVALDFAFPQAQVLFGKSIKK